MQTESKRRLGPIEWSLLGGVVLLVALLFVPRPTQLKTDPQSSTRSQTTAQEQARATTNRAPRFAQKPEEWGIEVVAIYPAINGRVLDLRYRILDTAKAALLPNEPGGIYLVDEATGETAMLPNSPKTGSIPQNPQKLQAGRIYSLSFPNPGERFKSGSKLTLVMGSFRAEHLTLQ